MDHPISAHFVSRNSIWSTSKFYRLVVVLVKSQFNIIRNTNDAYVNMWSKQFTYCGNSTLTCHIINMPWACLLMISPSRNIGEWYKFTQEDNYRLRFRPFNIGIYLRWVIIWTLEILRVTLMALTFWNIHRRLYIWLHENTNFQAKMGHFNRSYQYNSVI